MAAAFGEDWIKHRVPHEICQRWHEKRAKRCEREWPLLAYADFTDYLPIITKKNNWDAVFKPVFRRAEFVIEIISASISDSYLHHACVRLITQDDELYLYVETKRVLTAVGIIV